MCVSLSLVVEESDSTVVAASDEGWANGGQVIYTQGSKRSSEHV